MTPKIDQGERGASRGQVKQNANRSQGVTGHHWRSGWKWTTTKVKMKELYYVCGCELSRWDLRTNSDCKWRCACVLYVAGTDCDSASRYISQTCRTSITKNDTLGSCSDVRGTQYHGDVFGRVRHWWEVTCYLLSFTGKGYDCQGHSHTATYLPHSVRWGSLLLLRGGGYSTRYWPLASG